MKSSNGEKKLSEDKHNELLLLKFEGKLLKTRSVPIYELASALIAIQRIVYKVALFEEKKLQKSAHLKVSKREELALRISTHREGSDLWGLGPFLANPAVVPVLQGLIVAAISALSRYVVNRIRSGIEVSGKGDINASVKGSEDQNQLLSLIYPEVKQLSDRVGNIGGVEQITILLPKQTRIKAVTFDADTQAYVNKLEHEVVSGRRKRICGVVTELLPQSFRLDLKPASKQSIRVALEESLFERIRKLPVLKKRVVCLEGVPVYRMGVTSAPLEFHADKLVRWAKKRGSV